MIGMTSVFSFSALVILTCVVFCNTLVNARVTKTTQKDLSPPEKSIVITEEWKKYPMSEQRATVIRCSSIPILARISSIFTICLLMAITPLDAYGSAPTPDDRKMDANGFPIGYNEERSKLEWHFAHFAGENPDPARRHLSPSQYTSRVDDMLEGKPLPKWTTSTTTTATTTTKSQMPSTTPASPTLNSQADPSADGWSFPLSDEFSLVSQWGLIILACCLSIPAVIA